MTSNHAGPNGGEPTSLLRPPLYDAHAAAGARFTDFGGWELPVSYGSELAEHKAVREAVGLFDVSHMTEILVRGASAAETLDAALAGRASRIRVGRAKYSLLLDARGGIVDDLLVYRTGEDRFMVVSNAGNRAAVVAALTAAARGTRTSVADRSDSFVLLALQGPRTFDVLAALPGVDAAAAAALAEIPYYGTLDAVFAGFPVLVSRTGYTGEDGVELYLPLEAARPLWDAILAAGEPHGILPAGLGARDTLRLEAGMPLHGHELTRETLPQQAGLGRVLALDDGHEFTGRAAVEAGPAPDAPVLVGLAGEGRRAARAGYPVLAGGRGVGVVTSGALSPTLGHPIALAYVAPAAAVVGTALDVDVRGTATPFTVTELPFYRRKKSS